jgi:precorrin-6Y C5,15-methyltransferase (decarboxylating)
MNTVDIVGIGLSPEDLTEKHIEIINEAEVLAGGKRHLDYFKSHPAEKIVLTGDIKRAISEMKSRTDKKIVVLASGDPNFFGIGPLIVKSFGAENVCIHPNITAVSAAFSRLKESWSDVKVISLHGRRSGNDLMKAVRQNEKVAVFTDPEKTPSWIAKLLLKNGLDQLRLCVCENLGGEDESLQWYSPEECVDRTFADLNLVVIHNAGSETFRKADIYPGMPEFAYIHDQGLITKAEIRVLTLAKLRLSPHHIMWDLGAGSGSVSVDASYYVTEGTIIAVERRPDRIEHIRQNQERFGIGNLEIVKATLPEGMSELPSPDRIFVGGGGENMISIIETAGSYLKSGGIIVVNTILINRLEKIIRVLKKLNLETEVIHVQIGRGKEMSYGIRMEALNPVWIITGIKG